MYKGSILVEMISKIIKEIQYFRAHTRNMTKLAKNCVLYYIKTILLKEGKAVAVTGCGNLYGCGTPRLPHFLSRESAHR
jgi:hypothetical protein